MITPVRYSSGNWGDYDADGDLDVLVSGYVPGPQTVSEIFRNNSGEFSNINAGLTGARTGAQAWGDFDNDGDLDLLVLGDTQAAVPTTKIYRNDNGSFIDLNAGLSGRYTYNTLEPWGDYDNDGDLDILLAGARNSKTRTQIYRNDSGVFTDINFTPVETSGGEGCAAWVDFDNDGYLDVFNTYVDEDSIIYRNNGAGGFVNIGAGIRGFFNGAATWGDYDSDGDADLLASGWMVNGGPAKTVIYRNDSGVFTETEVGLPGLQFSSVAFGDYDNDGDLDILLNGQGSEQISEIYRNDSGAYTAINAGLTEADYGSAAWGDYDNDGDLDVLLTGRDNRTLSQLSMTKLYRNNSPIKNTVPGIPAGLTSTVDGTTVTFNWNRTTDTETSATGLTYNLRVGSAPELSDIVGPMANSTSGEASGYRRIPAPGNAGAITSRTIIRLAPGTYHWSVQAIDNCFAGSPFAPEQSLTISPPAEVKHWGIY